jgi:mRNA-degrading endonuclease RelE of RelBE toxin-antitoxin system
VFWSVEFHPAFESEFERLHEDVQDEILALMRLLKQFGKSFDSRQPMASGVWPSLLILSVRRSC